MTDNILALIAASASIALAPIRYDGYYSNRTRMSATGRGCVKRALILMSMGQRTTLAMNRQRRRLLVPL